MPWIQANPDVGVADGNVTFVYREIYNNYPGDELLLLELIRKVFSADTDFPKKFKENGYQLRMFRLEPTAVVLTAYTKYRLPGILFIV